jgi:hypothetical protein
MSPRSTRRPGRRTFSASLSIAFVFAIAGCRTAPHSAHEPRSLFREIPFHEAATEAAAEKKPIFVFFDGDWAGESALLLAKVFADLQVAQLLRERTIPIRIDVTTAPDLTKTYHVRDVPLLLLLAADGRELDRWPDVESPTEFARELTAAFAGETSVARLRAKLKPNDARRRLKLARALVARGSYDEAHAELLSLNDNPDLPRAKRWWVKSRTITLLAEIHQTHPPSAKTLHAWREQMTRSVLENPAHGVDAHPLRRIDEILADPDHLLMVFRQLPANTRAHAILRDNAFTLLVERRAYAEAATVMEVSTAVQLIEKRHDLPLIARGIIRTILPFSAGEVFHSHRLGQLSKHAQYFEVYAALGNVSAARRVAERIVATDKTGLAPQVLRDTAEKTLGGAAPLFLQSLELAPLEWGGPTFR